MTPVVVTGAAGYLGGRLVEALGGASSIDVRPLALRRVGWLPPDQLQVDLITSPDLHGAVAGAGAIIHLAGTNEVDAARDPDAALRNTVEATRRLLEAALAARVPRFVYVSTVHVYGDALRPGARVDEGCPTSPVGAYAEARLACEELIRAAGGSGMDVVILRLTNAVGAPVHPSVDRWTLVANDLCRQAVVDRRLTLRTDGLQSRDFVSLADAVAALAAAGGGELPPGTYNLGSGAPMTVRQLAEMVQDAAADIYGRRPPLAAPDPQGEPPEPYVIVVDRLAAAGFRAATPVSDAVNETLRFCVAHGKELGA